MELDLLLDRRHSYADLPVQPWLPLAVVEERPDATPGIICHTHHELVAVELVPVFRPSRGNGHLAQPG